MTFRQQLVTVRCWKCPMEMYVTADTVTLAQVALEDTGWREANNLTWCEACYRARLPSERWTGKFRSDRSQ